MPNHNDFTEVRLPDGIKDELDIGYPIPDEKEYFNSSGILWTRQTKTAVLCMMNAAMRERKASNIPDIQTIEAGLEAAGNILADYSKEDAVGSRCVIGVNITMTDRANSTFFVVAPIFVMDDKRQWWFRGTSHYELVAYLKDTPRLYPSVAIRKKRMEAIRANYPDRLNVIVE